MSKNDGGPAFPGETVSLAIPPSFDERYPGARDELKDLKFPCEGMALRDWFAGQALKRLAGDVGWAIVRKSANELAEVCYHMADAMLAEREKEKD